MAIEVDNEESDEEAMAEEVPPIEVNIGGVPDYAQVPWDETVIPDGVGVEEIDWSPWYASVLHSQRLRTHRPVLVVEEVAGDLRSKPVAYHDGCGHVRLRV